MPAKVFRVSILLSFIGNIHRKLFPHTKVSVIHVAQPVTTEVRFYLLLRSCVVLSDFCRYFGQTLFFFIATEGRIFASNIINFLPLIEGHI
jgi:hypothetical protein